MAGDLRKDAAVSVLRGLGWAVMVTLPGILILALMVVYIRLSDGALTALNQALKLAALFAGAWAAVRPGGNRGFALGAVVGLLYIALGYGVCALWDGMLVTGRALALEFALGALLGGVSGALVANLPARRTGARRAA